MKFSVVDKKVIGDDLLKKAANEAFSLLPKAEGEIELKFVGEKEIGRLNSEYRNIDCPTDVLSFTLSEKPLIGQIFICYNVAKRQAESNEIPIENEILLLLVHGILHIFGYDHIEENDATEMEKKEAEILNNIGVNL